MLSNAVHPAGVQKQHAKQGSTYAVHSDGVHIQFTLYTQEIHIQHAKQWSIYTVHPAGVHIQFILYTLHNTCSSRSCQSII